MKIKRKVEMNLPQLIEWVSENKVTSSVFWTSNKEDGFQNSVCFDVDGIFFTRDELDCCDIFTVEVEEEVTEDTEFEKLYYTTILSRIVESSCTTIQSSLKHIAVEPIAFYILNDDLTLTLIWRDGKLVE